MQYPQMGATHLLVYRECPQGCWCATGEGDYAPVCAAHGLDMVPGGGPEGMFGRVDGADHLDVMRQRRLGFAGLFGYEQGLLRVISDQHKERGLLVPMEDGSWSLGHHDRGRQERYFTEAEQVPS